jgi:hypothetical protein
MVLVQLLLIILEPVSTISYAEHAYRTTKNDLTMNDISMEFFVTSLSETHSTLFNITSRSDARIVL